MALLQIMPEDAPGAVLLRTRDTEEVACELAAVGVRYDRWDIDAPPRTSDQDEVLAAYRTEIDDLCAEGGFRLVDVARMHPSEEPNWPAKAAEARAKFLDEHRHDEHEVRFFVHGFGCFYLHLADRVHAVVCESGDLLSVPAGTRHWFDMGPRPDFVAIRFFQEEDGWIGDFTGDPIASTFPRLDELTAMSA